MRQLVLILFLVSLFSCSKSQTGGLGYWSETGGVPPTPPAQTVSGYMPSGSMVATRAAGSLSALPYDIYIADFYRKVIIKYTGDGIVPKNGTVVSGILDMGGTTGDLLSAPRKLKKRGTVIYFVDGINGGLNRIMGFNTSDPYGTLTTVFSSNRYIKDIAVDLDGAKPIFEQYAMTVVDDINADLDGPMGYNGPSGPGYGAHSYGIYNSSGGLRTPIETGKHTRFAMRFSLPRIALTDTIVYQYYYEEVITDHVDVQYTPGGFVVVAKGRYTDEGARATVKTSRVTRVPFASSNPSYRAFRYFNSLPEITGHEYFKMYDSADPIGDTLPWLVVPVSVGNTYKTLALHSDDQRLLPFAVSDLLDIENKTYLGTGLFAHNQQLVVFHAASTYDPYYGTPSILSPTMVFIQDFTAKALLSLDPNTYTLSIINRLNN